MWVYSDTEDKGIWSNKHTNVDIGSVKDYEMYIARKDTQNKPEYKGGRLYHG